MTGSSLDAEYFDGIFAADEDPWDLASSDYEAAKFAHTHDVLADRRYARALEIGCAHGVLTSLLAPLCDRLLATDISARALALARKRAGGHPGVTFAHMAFPHTTPDPADFDLVVLSEVAYYWDLVDLKRAGAWLRDHVAPGGRLILVHYTGETDYPHTADDAVETIWSALGGEFRMEMMARKDMYRLDLWEQK
ncbi:class I SAM-dependent DNA methyltransferase [Novosphingobium gossypii]|uniref:class I SAM-dependent DNA methyltransferase n=1 Tax=Novosphingobium gossypii TaxID=1604774 RepID=UPI003D25901D